MSIASRLDRDPRSCFVNVALSCVYSGEYKTLLQAVFAGIPEPLALDLAHKISNRLAQHATVTGDRSIWAEAQHHLPRPGQREAAQWFASRVDAWSVPKPACPVDDGARRLRRLACDLVRAGISGRELLRRLDEANATLPAPLSAEKSAKSRNGRLR